MTSHANPQTTPTPLVHIVLAGLLVLAQPDAVLAENAPKGSESPERSPQAPAYLDISGSMAGSKEKALKEAAKLLSALLDNGQELVLIDFNSSARSARFPLDTPAHRRAALDHIDGLRIDGGTDYVAAFKAAKLPAGVPALFVSDGEPNGPPEQVLEYLKDNPTGPLYTVAVEASPAAQKLLAEMAARTGGHFVSVEDSEGLVKVFIDLAKHLGQYRSYKPGEDAVSCPAVTGKLIAIGFDATPVLDAKDSLPDLISYHARLPGEEVEVTSVELKKAADLTILAKGKSNKNGRLAAVLRSDLLRAKMQVAAPGGVAAAGGALKVTTEFFDADGKPIDPRQRVYLSSEFTLLDQAGHELGRVKAKPGATTPVLEATLSLPKEPGVVTVTNTTIDASRGAAFDAQESRTVLVQKPLPIRVKPSSLDLTVTEGRFTARLEAAVADASKIPAAFTAEVDGDSKDLRLIDAQDKDGFLTLEFAGGAGSYKGAILVRGAASVALEPVRVPYQIRVGARKLGLTLPAAREVKLDAVLANSGKTRLAHWEIPSDDLDAVPYTIDVQDLSDGAAVIPLAADRATISPTKNKPAVFDLTADVGNVPAGEYKGAVVLKGGAGASAPTWRTDLRLTLTEPLTASPIDLGVVEVGKVVKRSFVIKNGAGALHDVTIQKPSIPAKGDAIAVKAPEKIDLAGGEEKEVSLSVAVPPLVESRGPLKGAVIIRRAGNQDVTVPIQITIVDEGKGPSALLTAPAKIELAARPGDVVQFDLRVKLAADATMDADQLTTSVGAFTDGDGRRADVDVVVKWQDARLTRSAAADGRGSVIAPDKPGAYRGEITIRSGSAGNVIIPVIIEVK